MTSSPARGLRHLGRSLITLQPAPGQARRAVRWVAAVAAGLLLTSLLLGPTKGGLGLLGAMSANAGREAPLRRRIRLSLGVGAATLTCQAIGLAISSHPLLVPPVMTVMTFVVVWTWHGLQIGPPGPINTVFAGAFGTYMGAHGWGAAELLGVTALSWALATGASLLILALSPHDAERSSVEAAEAAVDAYCTATTTQDGPEPAQTAILRSRAWRAVDDAWHVLRTGRTPGTAPATAEGRALEERLRAVHLRLVAVLQAQSFPGDNPDIAEHFDLVPMGLPSARYLLGTAAHLGSRPVLVAGRAAAAVLLASTLAQLSPVGHPYWAILSAIIVLHMGASRVDLTIRAAHRVVGTGVGVVAYLAIVSTGPGPWLRLGIVVVAIYGLESLVRRNYALAVVFVTVFALMLTPVSSETDMLVLMRDRLLDTILGAGVAALVTWVVGRRAAVLLVRRQYRLTLTALADVLADLAAGRRDQTAGPTHELVRMVSADPVRAHRRRLVFELGRAGALLVGQQPDDPAGLGPWTQVQREVSAFGYDIVAATWRPPGSGRGAAGTALTELNTVIGSLPPISARNIDPLALAEQVARIHADFLGRSPGPGRAGATTAGDP